jgi:hypothetical protein
VNHSLTEGEVEDVAHAAHAFVAADVAALVAEAAMTALRRHVSYQVSAACLIALHRLFVRHHTLRGEGRGGGVETAFTGRLFIRAYSRAVTRLKGL